jgi:lipoate-protein ligase A
VHAREVTYAVVAPLRAWGGLRAAYVAIHEALATALRALGAPARLAGRAAQPRPDAGPCFQSPASGEVTAGGRKLVGSAQARLDGALLQHGSILLEDDQELLDALGAPRGPRPATLRELVGDVSIDDVMDEVAMSLRETFGGLWVGEGWQPREMEAARRLELERYALESWIWRR